MTITSVMLFVVLPYAAVGQLIPAFLFRRTTTGPLRQPELAPLLDDERSQFGAWLAWCGTLVLVPLHLVPLLFPSASLGVLTRRPTLLSVELLGLVGGTIFLAGMGLAAWRRLRNARFSPLRTSLEVSALVAVLLATFSGVVVALTNRWGTAWYTTVLVPYLRSLALLRPDVGALGALGFWPQAHVATSFLAIALLPFTTLLPQWLRGWSRFPHGGRRPRIAGTDARGAP